MDACLENEGECIDYDDSKNSVGPLDTEDVDKWPNKVRSHISILRKI